jgi:hypothetical protein
MTQTTVPVSTTVCPSWCVYGGAGADHAHVSADVTAGAADQLLTARLVQMDDHDDPRVLLDGRVAELAELEEFVRGLRRLVDQAQLAPAGCGFVDDIVRQAGLTLTEVAETAGLEPSWVRAQHAGRQVLTVHQFDRLALAAAGLAAAKAL